jgi:hypothetical protein
MINARKENHGTVVDVDRKQTVLRETAESLSQNVTPTERGVDEGVQVLGASEHGTLEAWLNRAQGSEGADRDRRGLP